jgi:hypothetical protein
MFRFGFRSNLWHFVVLLTVNSTRSQCVKMSCTLNNVFCYKNQNPLILSALINNE